MTISLFNFIQTVLLLLAIPVGFLIVDLMRGDKSAWFPLCVVIASAVALIIFDLQFPMKSE